MLTKILYQLNFFNFVFLKLGGEKKCMIFHIVSSWNSVTDCMTFRPENLKQGFENYSWIKISTTLGFIALKSTF